MLLTELLSDSRFKPMTEIENPNKELKGVYCCDLLSWVMSHAKQGDA